ncbi:MAG: protein kinase [Planctomycetes bacterium]|nr:protein kinase [Planctomycetota bacterium]
MKCDDSFFGAESDRIDRLVARALDDAEADEPDAAVTALNTVLEQPGSQIDRYRLLRVLGEGGMGVVYLAEQTELVQRRVALKIIKPGMDSQRVLARFEAEKQALALMEHPYIAHVYDAGLAPSGRPYFVMEHIDGLPITKHCDEHRLTIEERLHLFLHICEAVQHAHQKGIVHRDLKPSNILVVIQERQAIPKIIDFGVARAISAPPERTLYTEQGQLIGTLEYMSPEQADPGNQDIDTRTDVYSLGVVLYELLAGVLPFDPETFRTGGIEQIRKVICEQDPKTPSTRQSKTSAEQSAEWARRRHADLRTLRRRLRGDLDWITLKALEKDRTRRYGTVDALTADIRNYLDRRPVAAAPPAVLYRARKFARRRRQTIGAVGAVILLLFVLLWALQAHHQAGQERIHAQALEHQRLLEEAQRLFETRGMQGRGASDSSNDALATLQPLLASRHVGPQARLLFASILVEYSYYEEAVPRLQKLLGGRREIAGAAYMLLARILWEGPSIGAEEFKKAEQYQQKAEQLLPETAEAYYLRALATLTIHDKLDLLDKALRLDPQHYPSRRLRALTYRASRDYRHLAEDALAMMLRREGDPQGYALRAAALGELGDDDEAVRCYDDALRLTPREDPQYVELHRQRGAILLRMGQHERVLAEAQACLKIAPQAADMQAQAFCALTALGRYQEADALWRAVRADPAVARLIDAAMKYVFDTRQAGRPWHPRDNQPEGPAFGPLFEAQDVHRSMSAKAHRLIRDGFSACWSPDGTKVAFSLGVPGNSGLAIYDPATKKTDLLIVPGSDPSWSPDGRHIAFVRDCEILRLPDLATGVQPVRNHLYFRGQEVWIIKADGTQPRRLARGAAFPSWSADSRQVYYQSRMEHMLYSISIEDPQAQPVLVFACFSYYPALSPDANCVAHVYEEGASELGSVRNGVWQFTRRVSPSRVAQWAAPLALWGGC